MVSGPGGRPRFLTGACADITDRKKDEEARARDAQVLASVRDSVIVTDLGGVVTYWNDGATRLFGWSAEEIQQEAIRHGMVEFRRAAMLKVAQGITSSEEVLRDDIIVIDTFGG